MRIGTGLIVACLGAILRFAIEDDWDGVDLEVIGTILMVIGFVAFATAVALEFSKRKAVEALKAPPGPGGAAGTAVPPTGVPPTGVTGTATPPRAQ